MESFGRYIAGVLTIGMLFFLLSYCCLEKTNELKKLYLEEKGERFLEETIEDGIITLAEWTQFCDDINRTRMACEFELTAGGIVQHGTQTQGIRTGYQMEYDADIVQEIYQKGSYQLREKTYFSLRIFEKKGKMIKVYFERARKMD